MKTPDRVPEKGFYYHYKHDPAGPLKNYAYEFLNVGWHTEDDSFLAIYRPLYESAHVYQMGKFYDIRPLDMWMEDVTKDGKTFSRFAKITDPAVIAQLEEIKRQMYS